MNKGRAGTSGPVQTGGGPESDQRRSHALQGLTRYLEGNLGHPVADLGGLNQQNMDFLTGLGHRLYANNLIASYDGFFSADEKGQAKASAARISEFVDLSTGGARQRFSAVLVWDRLQFLFPQVSEALVERLRDIMEPGGQLLALFHPESALAAAPLDCRILSDSAVLTRPRPPGRPIERFNARSIEKLFSRFSSVKFYVTRDSLQEVLIRR